MKKIYMISLISLIMTSCTCKCKYNDYLPENNPLVIPEDLRPQTK